MTRQQHDQFAKQYLEELLSPLGTGKDSGGGIDKSDNGGGISQVWKKTCPQNQTEKP